MLTAIKGTYDNGRIILDETPPVQERTEIIVTFLEKETSKPEHIEKGVRLGSWNGKYRLPDDFNEPLDDLADYV